MPALRSVRATETLIEIVQASGTKTLLASSVPGSNDTAAKWETFANTWSASNILDCQVRVHVFSLTPLRWTVGTWNLGAVIDPNWWVPRG